MNWSDFLKWLATSPLASFGRVVLAFVIQAAVTDFVNVGAFDFSKWQVWLIGVFAAASPLLLRWLNPEDKAFGVK